MAHPRNLVTKWTVVVPILGIALLALSLVYHVPLWVELINGLTLVASVLAAVHHAEVIAAKVGEPFGSLVLAVAVTVIEVSLIVILILSGDSKSTLARDTVFSAVMITMNGIIGISLFVATRRYKLVTFNPEGAGSALGTVVTLATLTMVLPRFTSADADPAFSGSQLAFFAVVSILLYGFFILTQTIRHRDYFLPPKNPELIGLTMAMRKRPDAPPAPPASSEPKRDDPATDEDEGAHAEPPSSRQALASLGLLFVSLVAVVGLTEVEGHTIEETIAALGFPNSFVGVVLAMMVLLPESIAAIRAAQQNRVQISINLGYGSAMASIGLTIPTLALLTVWIPSINLHLGLEPLQIALLAISTIVGILSVVPGRARVQPGVLQLSLFASFIFLSIVP
jgi:Ca2+:H+ antiporter